MDDTLTARQEWQRYWPLVLASLVGMSFYSIVTYTLGVFMEPLESEFGWSRTEVSAGLTIFMLAAFFGGPLVGALVDKVGTRRVVLPGLVLHALAFAAFGFVNGSTFQWLGLWTALAIVALATKGLIWSAAISNTFVASRSLALAVMLTGTAAGQASPILANFLIENVGWRLAYVWLGLGWGGVAFLLAVFFFFDARDRSRKNGEAQRSTAALTGLTSAQAMRDQRIWRIGIANVCMTFVGGGVSIHLVPLLTETGESREAAVAIAASAGISGIVGKLLSGVVLDRVQYNLVPFAAFAMPALGYFLLLDRFDSTALLTVGVLIIAFAGGASFQMTTYLVSRYGGMKNFGKIYGVISSAIMLGASLGPLASGMLYDATGSYETMLLIAIPVVLISAILFLGLGPYPDFSKTETVQQDETRPATSN